MACKSIDKIFRFYHGDAYLHYDGVGSGNGASHTVSIEAPHASQLGLTNIRPQTTEDLDGSLKIHIAGDWEWHAFVMLCHFVAANFKNRADEIVNPPHVDSSQDGVIKRTCL